MAANTSLGGYDLNWLEDPPDDLKCLICLCVARDPHQHPGDATNECGKVFCHSCITEYQRNKTTCPNCRESLTHFKDAKSARQIRSLKVKCDNDGCKWTGELGSLDAHLQSCDYALLPCTNKCKIDNDIAKFLRKDLKDHLTNDCPRRLYKCPHCQETGGHEERITTHLETCPNIKVSCPNPQCPVGILRSNIDNHRSTCNYESICCKCAEVGCEEKPLRKNAKKHEEDVLLHLQVTTDKVLELTKVNSHLLKSTSTLPRTISVTHYLKCNSDKDHVFSPPFYTSSKGYKMCLRVDANGWGDGKGTHVSVCAYLMKGDNDDSLSSWPFHGTVTFELLNQLEDANHHNMSTTFPADGEHSQRVVDDKIASNGYGISSFISHADLDYNANENTQYLKEDTLVFRVSVQVPDHKPWLE